MSTLVTVMHGVARFQYESVIKSLAIRLLERFLVCLGCRPSSLSPEHCTSTDENNTLNRINIYCCLCYIMICTSEGSFDFLILRYLSCMGLVRTQFHLVFTVFGLFGLSAIKFIAKKAVFFLTFLNNVLVQMKIIP